MPSTNSSGYVIFSVVMILVAALLLFLLYAVKTRARQRPAVEAPAAPSLVPDEALAAVPAEDRTELVAILTAAVMAYMESTGRGADVVVRSIRRTGRTNPSWNLAGRDVHHASKL